VHVLRVVADEAHHGGGRPPGDERALAGCTNGGERPDLIGQLDAREQPGEQLRLVPGIDLGAPAQRTRRDIQGVAIGRHDHPTVLVPDEAWRSPHGTVMGSTLDRWRFGSAQRPA
jgi:hypothetical protein